MAALADSMQGDHPARPVRVISNIAGANGLTLAAQRNIPTRVIEHAPFGSDRAGFEEALSDALAAANPDVICLAGFMRILTPEFVARWSGRMLNIHPSLLPKYKGLHTHRRAIEAGDKLAGCSVHEVSAELDGGPILGRAEVPILPGDTPDTLAARVLVQEHRLYPAVLRRFCQGNRDLLTLRAE